MAYIKNTFLFVTRLALVLSYPILRQSQFFEIMISMSGFGGIAGWVMNQ